MESKFLENQIQGLVTHPNMEINKFLKYILDLADSFMDLIHG